MATYAIGDLQGCDQEFAALLAELEFSSEDNLWLVGDLINRGPESLQVLRRIKAMADQCTIVLGNHDLHFLAIYFGGHNTTRSDTFDELLVAPDVDELAHWLRTQKLMHLSTTLNYVMVHAGLPHIWKIPQALNLAHEVENIIAGRDARMTYVQFFEQMYGNEPDHWEDGLEAMPRMRAITNYLTRMRLVNDTATMNFTHKGVPSEAPSGFHPWFDYLEQDAARPIILFGHWAALDGETSRADVIALDTGCVWGRELTALNLETGTKTAYQKTG